MLSPFTASIFLVGSMFQFYIFGLIPPLIYIFGFNVELVMEILSSDPSSCAILLRESPSIVELGSPLAKISGDCIGKAILFL